MTRTSQAPPWPDRPALFLDLDGTLLEFAPRPEQAAASPRVHSLLPRLAPGTEGAVAVVSGRPIAELDRLLAPNRFAAAGIHGLEWRASEADGIHYQGRPESLDPVREGLAPFVEQHEGVLLEDKRYAVALHYRQRPDLETQARAAVDTLIARLPESVQVLRGKMVVEFKSGQSDKGKAIQAFMNRPPFKGRTPVFLGDDVTDEAGFDAVNALAGISVKVGAGDSAARWRLASVDAVVGWLEAAIDNTLSKQGTA